MDFNKPDFSSLDLDETRVMFDYLSYLYSSGKIDSEQYDLLLDALYDRRYELLMR